MIAKRVQARYQLSRRPREITAALLRHHFVAFERAFLAFVIDEISYSAPRVIASGMTM